MKQMRKKNNLSHKQNILLVVVAVALVLVLVLVLVLSKRTSTEIVELQKGWDFLQQQEQKNPDFVRQARRDLYVRRMEAVRDELLQKIVSGEQDPFPLLQDYVVMGDSRSVGFHYYGFLDEKRVFADLGDTILEVDNSLESLEKTNPSYVYLCYGLNDIISGLWRDGREYAQSYMAQVKKIQEILPEATIVVSSILPATEDTFDEYPNWENIPQWNDMLEEACTENGILFADCDWVFEEYSDWWQGDGHHLMAEVYPYWAGQLLITTLYGNITNEA